MKQRRASCPARRACFRARVSNAQRMELFRDWNSGGEGGYNQGGSQFALDGRLSGSKAEPSPTS